jgi:hypothetical protein
LEFEEDDLELGRIGDGRRENFERAWLAPEEIGELVVGSAVGWLSNALAYGETSGAVGRVKGISGTTVRLIDVVSGPNGAFTAGETVTEVYPATSKGAVIADSGRGDRTSKRAFINTGVGAQPPFEGTVEIYGLATDETVQRAYDDGAGNLLGDVEDSGANTVDYALGNFDVTFAKPLKAGAYVFMIFKMRYVSSTVTSYTKTSGGQAGNTDAIYEFEDSHVVISSETFEASWKSPQSSITINVSAGLIFTVGEVVYTSISGLRGVVIAKAAGSVTLKVFNAGAEPTVAQVYVSTNPITGESVIAERDTSISTTVTGFVKITQASPWNDSAVMDGSFESGAATADLGTFDTGAEAYEDFEEGWYTNEGSKYAYSDVSGSATFDLGPFADSPPEDFEDFDDWTTTLSL